MKRRNSRKCDSFDFIKVTSKKPNSYVYSLHLNNIYETQAVVSQSPLLPSAQRRQKYFLQLPKIHSYPAQRNKSKESQCEYYAQKSRLLLLGSQYKKDSQIRMSPYDKKAQQELSQLKKKVTSTKDNFLNKRSFITSILYTLNIVEVQNEKKKTFIFVEEGNNSRMVKEIFRKRSQINFTNDKSEANIIWTRFCDYQSSKLSSKFEEKVVSQILEDDQIHERSIQNSTIIENPLPSKTIKHKLLVNDLKYHNHLHNHHQISDKKSLFSNLQIYCTKSKLQLEKMVPKTFEIKELAESLPDQIDNKSLWVVKPGQDTNRGQGISVAMGHRNILADINELIKSGKTALVQKYIEPLLFKNRKFDIRCFVLVISFRGQLKAYWYREGYLRTCSKQFNYDPEDKYAHLTNDAIQKKCNLYGKFEQGNKLSFNELEQILKSKELKIKQILDSMKKLAYHSIKSAQQKLKGQKNQFSFQIFGYDFLIDKKGKPWLIQINTNPCLEFSGSLTSRILWHMVDNSFKICIDPLIYSESKEEQNKLFQDNKFQYLI